MQMLIFQKGRGGGGGGSVFLWLLMEERPLSSTAYEAFTTMEVVSAYETISIYNFHSIPFILLPFFPTAMNLGLGEVLFPAK